MAPFRHIAASAIACVGLSSGSALAQNTASIPGAQVREGELFVEYRSSLGDAGDGRADPFSQRIHVNYAPSSRVRLMLFVEQRKIGDGPLRTRRFSPNIFTQFVDRKNWDLAVRWQGDIPLQDGVPGRARIGLLNSFKFGSIDFRSNIYFGKEIGDNAPDGFVFETREEIFVGVNEKSALGLQIFNNVVTTQNLSSFNDQRHQAGPFYRTQFGEHVRVEASALFGFSRAATDAELRLFAGYSF
jgi:hypothetical protein